VARAVIQLAGALRLDTVAEGIENAAQARRLRELGYTLGQGFHLGRPMSAADMTALLARQSGQHPSESSAILELWLEEIGR
jgi:diguanylate cyclase